MTVDYLQSGINRCVEPCGGGGGITAGANVGAGTGEVFRDITAGTTFNLRTILSPTGTVSIVTNGDVVELEATASNVGGGEGIFAGQVLADKQFKTLTSTGATVTITSTATTVNLEAVGGGGGEVNTASNIGTGTGVFSAKVLEDLEFKSLTDSGPITVSANATEVNITSSAEANTASNIGTGTGVFSAKVLEDLEFRSLISSDLSVSITTAAGNIDLTTAGGGGGFLTTNIGYVDVTLGNDGTAAIGNPALPYLTVAAACAAAVSGQVIVIRPGTYVESNITVPAGVTVIGESWQSVRVGDPAAVAQDVFVMGNGSYLQGLGIEIPLTAGRAGVLFNGPAGGLCAVNLVTFYGDGLSPTGRSGDGLYKRGGGKVIAFEIRTELGGMNALQRVDSGALAVESTHVPNSAGDIAAVALVEGGRYQSSGFNCGNVNVVRVLDVQGATSIVRVFSANWFDPAGAGGSVVGLYIGVDGPDIEIVGGSIETPVSVQLDLGVTYTSATRVLLNVVQEPAFSFPPSGLNVDFTVVFQQRNTDTRDSETRTLGTAVTAGFPEKGSAVVGGEGGSYSDGVRVFTTTGAFAGTDGINPVDITATAVSKTAGTFQFPSGAVGDTITFTTQRFDSSGNSLLFYGVDIVQTLGALDGAGGAPAPGTFVFEIWTGATWSEVGVMAVSTAETFRYANDIFQRPIGGGEADETIRFGVYGDTLANDVTLTWTLAAKAALIAAGTQYWARVRVVGTVTQNPVFRRIQLLTSTTTINNQGRRLATGLALWQTRLFTSGGVWGSSAGVANGTYTVGNGGVFPGQTAYDINRSKLNGAGDQVTFQFPLPTGICTAFPLTLRPEIHLLNSGVAVTTAGVLTVGAYPLQAAGVQVADPTGAIPPAKRIYANTNLLTALTGQGHARDIIPTGEALLPSFTTKASLFELDFGPYNIGSVYSDDVVGIALEYTSDSSPATDVQIWTLEIEGVAFIDGSSITEL